MKSIKMIVQSVLKYRTSVLTIFAEPLICHEWFLFGKYKVYQSFRSLR